MKDLRIKTTIGTYPTYIPTHEINVIKRGETSQLVFDLSDKIYGYGNNIDSLDQLMFILKQGKKMYWYSMYTYLVPTEDTEVVVNKEYYENITKITDSETNFQCTADLVAEPAKNPKESNYYEVVEGNHSWRDTCYLLDDHFYYDNEDGCNCVKFTLTSAETKQLKVTTPDTNVQFEVVVRLNTDIYNNLSNKDSIIIEPQHSIAVVDSLYGNIL